MAQREPGSAGTVGLRGAVWAEWRGGADPAPAPRTRAAYCLVKSTERAAGAPPVIVVTTLRSPNCGLRNTISRTPRAMETLAIGVSPTRTPSIQTSAHGSALMFAVPRGSRLIL